MGGALNLIWGDKRRFPRRKKSLQKQGEAVTRIGLAAEGAVRASGEVFKGLVNDVMKCKHYPKGRKEPLKGFKDTKCLCLEI